MKRGVYDIGLFENFPSEKEIREVHEANLRTIHESRDNGHWKIRALFGARIGISQEFENRTPHLFSLTSVVLFVIGYNNKDRVVIFEGSGVGPRSDRACRRPFRGKFDYKTETGKIFIGGRIPDPQMTT